MTHTKQSKAKAIKLEFAPSVKVTSFGGTALAARLMRRLSVTSLMEQTMPARQGYRFPEIISSAVTGLLTGARGTFATQVVREDPALLRLSGLERAPEEVTFWRALGDLGEAEPLAALKTITLKTARRAVDRSSRAALLDSGFVPVFLDGTLLEGSARREGSKHWKDHREGLLWTAAFIGPYPVLGEVANKGRGEITAARRLLKSVSSQVLKPTGLGKDALVLCDSLHGNGPTFEAVEAEKLAYVIGTRNLVAAESALGEQPETQWIKTPDYDARRGVLESGVCVASVQCKEWPKKRTLIGRRWKRRGELIWSYASVVTNLTADDKRVAAIMKKRCASFGEAIWLLYNRKGACENHFKNLLIDLKLHHPPCREWRRNAAFYGIGLLAGLIATAIDVLGSPPGRYRRTIATLRRWFFAVPVRVSQSGRVLTAQVLGLSEQWRERLRCCFHRLARC